MKSQSHTNRTIFWIIIVGAVIFTAIMISISTVLQEWQQRIQAARIAIPTMTVEYLETKYQKGLAYINIGRWEDAQAELELVFETDPNYKDVQIRLKEIYLEIANLKATPAIISSPQLTRTEDIDGGNGLVVYYPFDGNSDDKSGNENHGFVSGAQLTVDRFGQENRAYKFDGIDDKIIIPDNPALDIVDEITLAAWVKVENYGGGEGIISKVWTNSRSPWELGIDTGTKRFRFMGGADYRKNLFHVIDNGTIELDQWYHIVGTASNGVALLYINGIEATSENYSGSFWENEYDVFIGTRWTQDQRYHHYFNGTIDDVRIYNYALSESEIQTLYVKDR